MFIGGQGVVFPRLAPARFPLWAAGPATWFKIKNPNYSQVGSRYEMFEALFTGRTAAREV
jgi:hypothetical protein